MSFKYIHPCKSYANFFFAGYGITQLILHNGYRYWVSKLLPPNSMRVQTKSNIYYKNRKKTKQYRIKNNKDEKVSHCFLSAMKHGKRQRL